MSLECIGFAGRCPDDGDGGGRGRHAVRRVERDLERPGLRFKITYEEIAPDVLRKDLHAAGVPADDAEFLLVILGFLAQGFAERKAA